MHIPSYHSPVLAFLAVATWAAAAIAGDVKVSLSTRETYVNASIALEIRIDNAQDYSLPELPSIDGVEIRSAGPPATSYQTLLFNGKRTELSSETLTYLLTPLRPGTFEVPRFTMTVDGKEITVEGAQFVVTQSETGDLLFVEVAASKEQVYVGEPLELTLRIDLKPYRNREAEITLSEGDMWRMLSKQTSWGTFDERLRELEQNNQRPGGREVLRTDGEGNERSYYRYEIRAQIYPAREGNIDASDIRVIVNYPTALGKSRGPFGSFFEDDPFNSPLSRRMQDDFGSPFGNQLMVTESRPIVAEVQVASTRVLAVPTQGRPADYRGAVGTYRIVTEASPTQVQAGDSIKLDIGIVGTGPMELVQAPPLAELPELAQFKVPNEPLAGFVRDDAKVFSTSIRPRQAGISEIPPIPFSFFDPDAGEFKTVYSPPIAISVAESESLGLDAIRGGTQPISSSTAATDSTDAKLADNQRKSPLLDVDGSADVLQSQTTSVFPTWLLLALVLPPVAWGLSLFVGNRRRLAHCSAAALASFRTPQQQFASAIAGAKAPGDLLQALVVRINRLLGVRPVTTDRLAPTDWVAPTNWVATVGALRTRGAYTLAAEVESFACGLVECDPQQVSRSELDQWRQSTLELNDRIAQHFSRLGTLPFSSRLGTLPFSSRPARPSPEPTRPMKTREQGTTSKSGVLGLLAICTLAGSLGEARVRADQNPVTVSAAKDVQMPELTEEQLRTLLKEATESYRRGAELASEDLLESHDLFQRAAERYELLVNSGVNNSQLLVNLGNAYLQSRRIGWAIANYERALQLDPDHTQARWNRDFAVTLADQQQSLDSHATSTVASWSATIGEQHERASAILGYQNRLVVLGLASLIFWGLAIARTLGAPQVVGRLAILPLLILVLAGGSLALSKGLHRNEEAIIVEKSIALRAGDGEEFGELAKLEGVDGRRVRILEERADWQEVAVGEQKGWMPASQLARLP